MSIYCDMQPIKCLNKKCNFIGVHGQLIPDYKLRKLTCPDCSGAKFKILN